ncbi:scavenger receptor class B, member, variant 2 [Chamberlinius hualienensis]
MHCCTPRCSIITVIVGAFFCIGSGLLLFFIPDMISHIVTGKTELSTSSFAFEMWQHIPVNIYRKFYVFNYTNWEDFVNDGKVPAVEQLGPYVYKEVRYKIFLDWDGEYVRYRETHTFYFVPELSVGSEDDVIWTPNVPLVSTVATVAGIKTDSISRLTAEIDDMPAFVSKSVGTILFYGYPDPLMEILQNTTGDILPGSIYAMFYGKNATDDGHYEIHRGYNDITEVYRVHKWNDLDTLNMWPANVSSGCNMFNGTDGSFYWPGIKRDDKVNIFISDVCRHIFVEYVEDMEMYGIAGYKYASNVALFADPNMNPDNYCYCNPTYKDCVAPGIAALGPCKFDSPIFLSHPHFKFADNSIVNAIEGLDPNNPEKEYRTVVNIEPVKFESLSNNL